jgi:hypothetical protein
MVKKLLFVFCLFLLQRSLFAQSNFRFADSTAQWNVTEYTPFQTVVTFTTTIYKLSDDTIIGSKSYQKITSANNNLDLVRRDSANKIYHIFSGDSIEYLIYDFNKSVGDTFSIMGGRGLVDVLSVDTILLDRPRKRMSLNIDFGVTSRPYNPFTCIDGIGAINSQFLFPGVEVTEYNAPAHELLCYYQKDSVIYHSQYFAECYISSPNAINNLIESRVVHVLPNPAAQSYVDVQIDVLTNPLTFEVEDIAGKLVLKQDLVGNLNRVELSSMSKGIYFYSIRDTVQKISSGKLIIQ